MVGVDRINRWGLNRTEHCRKTRLCLGVIKLLLEESGVATCYIGTMISYIPMYVQVKVRVGAYIRPR